MRIKTSVENKKVISILTRKFNFDDETYIMRIAIALTLQKNYYYEVKEFEKLERKGKENVVSSLVGKGLLRNKSNDFIFKAIFDQHYNEKLTEEDYIKLLNIHLDKGLKILKEEILSKEKDHFDFLINLIDNGQSFLTNEGYSEEIDERIVFSQYEKVLNLKLGKDKEEDYVIPINDTNMFDSQHIAIAGMTGSGKTQLIKDIVYQIVKKSNEKINYIFFDYKGEGKSDDNFVKKTTAKFIDPLEVAFKFNPLSFIENKNKRKRGFDIKSFVDSIEAIQPRIGVKQTNHLRSIVEEAFDKVMSNNYPNFKNIYDTLVEYYEERDLNPDTLFSTIKDLSTGIFDSKENIFTDKNKLYENNIYLNLPSNLSDTLRQLTVFIILRYLFSEFSKGEEAKPDENGIVPIRYVIVIDEAHFYLKKKNARKILERLLREIRSKGVMIVLLTQGIEDYKTKQFDFTSQIKVPICLNIKNKNYISQFIGSPSSENDLANAINNLNKQKGIVNIKETKLIDINQFWKRFD